MDGGTGPGAAELLSPAEAEWPPELRLPPPPPPGPLLRPKEEPASRLAPQSNKEPSPPRHAPEGFDDQHFLGSIMGAAAAQPQQAPAAEAPVKRKRGRPPKNRNGAAAAPAPAPARPSVKKDEEIVCFICFDGGNLVVCDRRGCPKVYHPACIKRDESFFRAKGKWDCGWHICSVCEKAAHYMCYTCTYSLCKGCIGEGSFFGVRGNKGFCDTCYGTILLIESKDEGGLKIKVDFDDKNSWEYLFKLYWLDLKGKHLLTLEELIGAKSCWTVPGTAGRREKEESSDESYDANNDQDANFDISSRKRRQNNPSGKRGRKRQKAVGVTARKREISTAGYESLPSRLPTEGMVLQGDTKWASPELLEFVGHMRNGDSSCISQHGVQILLLEYIKQNNLRDPHKKSQVICDARLSNLFRKPRVAHFEMLKLLEMHFHHVKENPIVNADSHPDSSHLGSDKRRKIHKKIDRELTVNPEDYAAIDMHNINLIYLRRSLMEDLIDDKATFSDKIAGAFVRIRISGLGQKKDMYRLVKVLGTHKVAERYSVGKKTTDYALEISNLDKKEVITMDTISNQDFTEEECKRLRQSMKFGLVARLKVGDIYEKAKIFQALQFNDWLESEKQRLSHLRDRASETGRRKQLRECVEQLQLLNTPEERERKINEVPEVHADPHMAPDYESAEEQYYKKAADWTINRSGSDILLSERTGTKSNSVENHTEKSLDASGQMSSLPIEGMAYKSVADINLNSTAVETASFTSSGAVLSDNEPEKVWHYKDPSGNVQGPFTLSQLSNWASYFPRDLRIWLSFESEKNSFLLTEVLLKKQKDSVLPSAVTTGDSSVGTGTGQDRVNSDLVANNLSCPIGYNVVHSSGLSSQSVEFSDPTTEGSTVLYGPLPSRSLKDAHNLHGQVHHKVNYSHSITSSTLPGSHDERVPREHVGDWNNPQDIGGMWSPTVSSVNHSFKSNVKSYPHPEKGQLQNHSKNILPVGSVASFDSQTDSDFEKVSVLTLQQSDRGHIASLSSKSPSEENTCWLSSTDASTHDDLQLSTALAKQERCSPTNPVEDRDSSSASGVPNQVPKQVPSMSTTNSSKTTTINQHTTSVTDASSKLNNDAKFSSDTHQGREYEYPSPTPELERKPQSFENFVPVSTEEEQPQCSSPIALSPWGEQNYYHGEAVDSALWGIQDDHSNDIWSMHSPTPAIQPSSGLGADGKDASCIIEEVMAARESNTFVETLVKQGDTKMQQGNSSASTASGALEEVKTKPSSALGPKTADCQTSAPKTAGCQSSGTALEGSSKPSRWKPPGLLLEGITNASDWQPSYMSKEGGSKAPSSRPSDSSLGVEAKASVWKQSNSSTEEGPKASAWQLNSIPDESRKGSTEGGMRASGRQQTNVSPEGSRKDSGWQRSGSSAHGNTKASGRQSSISAERSAKVDGWQRTSSSPEGNRKASGWHPSDRERSRANSTSGASDSENHKSSSSLQATTPTAKNSWEAPRKHGNNDKSSVGWGEALGNNRNWNTSSGNASRGSQVGHNHDRHGGDSRRGISYDSRRSDHQDHDYRQDHGRYRSRSFSRGQSPRGQSPRGQSPRGQSPRGVCKYYEKGHCYKGNKCYYLHR